MQGQHEVTQIVDLQRTSKVKTKREIIQIGNLELLKRKIVKNHY